MSSALTYFVANLINAIIPFALLPILTRHLGPSEYGLLAVFQSLLGLLGGVIGLNSAAAAARKYYDNEVSHAELAKAVGASIQIVLLSGVIALTAAFAFESSLSAWLNLPFAWVVGAVVVSVASATVQLRLSQWQIRGEATRYGIFQVAQSLVNVSLSILLVVVLHEGAVGRVEAQVGVSAVFALVAVMLLQRDRLIGVFTSNWRQFKEALIIGVPLVPHTMGIFLLSTVDRLVISSMIGFADAGIYMAAAQLAAGAGLVFDALNKAYVPWLFERLKRNVLEEKKQIVRMTYAWFAIILVGGSLGFILGPGFVKIVAGDTYVRGALVIGWLLLGQAFGGMYLMVTNYVFYSKRTGLLSAVTIASGVINVLLLLYLTPRFGIAGAAWAFCISMALRFALTWCAAQSTQPMPWLTFRPTALTRKF